MTPFEAPPPEPLRERIVPVSAGIAEYDAPTARRDLVAGLTVAALAVPAAMAYAEVAGVGPINGLYALLLPTIVYVFLGSSRQLVVGPEGAIAALTGAVVLERATAGSADPVAVASMVALLVAACCLVAWATRLGWIADYFSRPVLVGYMHGVVVILICGQLGKLLGIKIEATEPIGQLVDAVKALGDASAATVAVSVSALTLLLVARAWLPKLPAALIVVAGFILASWALDLAAHGVAVVGAVPSGLPDLSIPSLSGSQIVALIPDALGIFVVTYADGILTARTFAGRRGQHVRANQELLAFAGMSAAAGVTQGFPLGASGSRTAVNDQMGARTQIAGLFAVAAVLLVLFLLTEPLSYLPSAVLGAVIVSAAISLVDFKAWRALAAARRFELWVAVITLAGVVVLGVLEALVVAVVLSILDVVRRSARPHDAVLGWVERLGRYADVELHPSAETTPGVVVYRLDDRLFFANADYVKGRVAEAVRASRDPVRAVVFDADGVADVDVTGSEALGDLVTDLRKQGAVLSVARMRTRVREQLSANGTEDLIGEDRFFPTVRAAVAAADQGGSND